VCKTHFCSKLKTFRFGYNSSVRVFLLQVQPDNYLCTVKMLTVNLTCNISNVWTTTRRHWEATDSWPSVRNSAVGNASLHVNVGLCICMYASHIRAYADFFQELTYQLAMRIPFLFGYWSVASVVMLQTDAVSFEELYYWHCLHSMRSSVYETVERPSVCLSHHSTTAAACGGFAAERRAGKRYRSTVASTGRRAAAAPQHGAQ